jgi:hypothetical protein
MSRRRAIHAAATSSATVARAGRSSTAGRAPVNGRSSSAQPSGVTHRSQPAEEVSATIRTSSATASAPPAMPIAVRRVGATWLASAPTATKTGSGDTSAIDRNTDGPAPARPSRIPTSRASHTTVAPMAMPASAEPNAVARLTAPERTSSWRPSSSSARSARTAASMPHSPAKIANAPSRHDM